jgi:hypothetical protein
VVRRADQRTAVESQQLTQLRAQPGELEDAITLTEDVVQLIRQRQGVPLDPWLERAAQSTLGMFRRFAQGLRDDYAAVKAGMTLPWSTGPVEGHMNRLKMLKRQMCGRARLDSSAAASCSPHAVHSGLRPARRHRRRHSRLLPSDAPHDSDAEGQASCHRDRSSVGLWESSWPGATDSVPPLRRGSILCGTRFTKSGQEPIFFAILELSDNYTIRRNLSK